jgi:hypothetical protein
VSCIFTTLLLKGALNEWKTLPTMAFAGVNVQVWRELVGLVQGSYKKAAPCGVVAMLWVAWSV